MKKLPFHLLLLFLFVLAYRASPVSFAAEEAVLDFGEITEEHLMVPMRDGVKLSVYLYRPAGDGPWPVIFEQRYASLRGKGTRESAAKLARSGYVVALVNYRGSHLSEGKWVGYRAMQFGGLRDGYDVCEWFAGQPWSTGKIGSFGSSQGGYAQNYLAVTQPPHLVCQYMVDTGVSLFHEGYRIGGGARPERFKSLGEVCRNPQDNEDLLKEWAKHPTYDDYWAAEDCSPHFGKMEVPCITIGSWYDFMNQGSIASFIGREHEGGVGSRGQQWLLIGPWLHGRTNKGTKNGELEYPANAAWDTDAHMLRWFDYWLKGIENGVTSDPKVRWYEMGAVGEGDAGGNLWHEAADFPPAAEMQALYLHEEGGLNGQVPTAAHSSTSLRSDPRSPMQIPAGGFPGAKDARAFESQAEVRTFTTEILTEAVAWTGRVQAELLLSSTAVDTDVIVRVSDVYPDGRSILIIDYPQRERRGQGTNFHFNKLPKRIWKRTSNLALIENNFRRR